MRTKKQQAKNSFKTFVVTLSVSIVIFSSLYYLIGNFTKEVDIEKFNVESETAYKKTVKGSTTKKSDSPFANLKETSPQVLSGTDTDTNDTTETDTTTNIDEEVEESTESEVPETGSYTLIGTILSVGFFSLALITILSGPRKMALSKFENSMLED